MIDWSKLIGVFHVSVVPAFQKNRCVHMRVFLIPNEGNDHDNVQEITLARDPGDGSIPAQVELWLMEQGAAPTWVWGWDTTLGPWGASGYYGEFSLTPGYKECRDSGAYNIESVV